MYQLKLTEGAAYHRTWYGADAGLYECGDGGCHQGRYFRL